MNKINTIDEYIASQSEELQIILQKVRDTIHKAAPKAIEKISWQMPTFWQGKNLIHFYAFKKHLGIFPGDLTLSPFKERLSGYTTSKGAIQFPYDKTIDYKLIRDITKWRLSVLTEPEGKSKADNKTDRTNKNNIENSRMTRKIHPVPGYVKDALEKNVLLDRYNARPPYQRNDYVGWITRAKREETRQKRLDQMLDELRAGDAYMGMNYNAKK